jgi:D-alanyl-D-alanine carboxypeptidase
MQSGDSLVNNSSLPEKTSHLSISPSEDIPEALREIPAGETPSQLKSRLKWRRSLWVAVGFAIALILGVIFNGRSLSSGNPALLKLNPAFTATVETAEGTLIRQGIVLSESLLGHLPYNEAPVDTLVPIVADGSIKLRQAAAAKFTDMVAAAQSEGIDLLPISGFRTIQDQEYLFFDMKAQRGQQTTERAEVSAPPGYSEHHTGYAVDIGDGDRSDTDLQTTFENTDAFRWLQQNAAYFSFELSFPQNNSFGVSYEPWHWRFVGDRDSLETFYKART